MRTYLSYLPKEIEEKILEYVLQIRFVERQNKGWKGVHQELEIYNNNNREWKEKMYRYKIDRWRNSGFNLMISPRSRKFWKIKNRAYPCICGHKNDVTIKVGRCLLPGCNCNKYVIPKNDYMCSNCKRNPKQPWTWGITRISL
jgi:hypothetical protein